MTRRDAAVEVATELPVAPSRRRARGRDQRPRATPALLTAMVAVALMGWLAPGWGPLEGSTTTLEVVAHGEDRVAFERVIEVGESFRLEHTHSVTKRPVIETFSAPDEDTLAIEELWFDEPGPNLPAGPEPSGDGTTTFLHENGAFRVLHHSAPIGSLPLMVGGPEVDHTLVFADGQRVRLLDVVRRGERVEVTVGGTSSIGGRR